MSFLLNRTRGGGGGGGVGDGPLSTVVDDYEDGSAGTPTDSNWSYDNEGVLDSTDPIAGDGSLQLDGGGSNIELTRSSNIQPSSIRFFVRNDETQSSESDNLPVNFQNSASTNMIKWLFINGGNISPDAVGTTFSEIQWRDGEIIQCDIDNITYTGSDDTYDATVKNLSTDNSATETDISKANDVDFGGFETGENTSWRIDDLSHS